MKNLKFNLKSQLVIFIVTAMLTLSVKESQGQTALSKSTRSYTHRLGGNPYLPLWEHLPDGEPRVFEDPDSPGKYRAYIIGSHDVRADSYCGSDIRAWSAPVEDLTNWRDEGPIFTYQIGRAHV